MNCEELEALEAVLAFVNARDDTTDLSPSHSTDASSYSVPIVPDDAVWLSEVTSDKKGICEPTSAVKQEIVRLKEMIKIPGRNRSRDLQKLETLQLQMEAEELQQRIQELRYTKMPVDEELLHPSTGTIQRPDGGRLDAWLGLAKRQKRLRNEAESENEYLRGLVQSQMKTIKKLKRLFHNQTVAKKFPSLVRRMIPTFVPDNGDHGLKVLERLGSSLNDLFLETDHVFQSNGFSSISSPFSQVNSQPLSSSSTRIEVLKCDVLPFDYRTLAKAIMRNLASDYTSDGKGKHIPPNLDMKVAARVDTLVIEELMKIQLRYMAVRHAEDNREVIVLTGQDELLEVFGVAVDGIKLQERSWCVLSAMSPGVCLLQMCMTVTVQAQPLLKDRREFTNKVCDLIARFEQEMSDSSLKEVEHELLHAAAQSGVS
ncbi:hypothetical protein F441_16507 [Phytophthora nicotianae CJ01A1]|uniref:Uncharacterized protein n=3 Tax=Phytophthora nicotianae TaxID=4792 RepID=W2IA69_PHYNI|nr:hypothetical protein L915_12673 [Phytophthora nicotianae]ETL30990.1 hypothetical protein L916_16096 [Phytophthora nicotianae]ETO66074.1 hypothetical protein F444_16675 [Phytophthora nicotianae P1976]ETP07174.1 hypothetical protein F441_16507 [Phytophthora nicotianae CJ01A1]